MRNHDQSGEPATSAAAQPRKTLYQGSNKKAARRKSRGLMDQLV
jgi:hypothetical protein